MVFSGEKKEEYREMKPYWNRRLSNKDFDAIRFRNGYANNAPEVLIEWKGLCSGLGIIEWGAPPEKVVYIIKLGNRILNKSGIQQ